MKWCLADKLPPAPVEKPRFMRCYRGHWLWWCPAVGRGYHLCPQFCLCCGLAGTHLTDNCTCQRNCYCRGITR